MEGVGAEISQKIKSAIKAKLMEIGAFVDDELPDYIMVMVANKRTKSQMNDDLSLFLGSNTHHFTSWLHSVLEQLKQVTLISQSAKGLKDSVKRKLSTTGESPSGEKDRKRKRKGSKDESEPQGSSLPMPDITDRIKQELISEFSKDAIIAQAPSEKPAKNKEHSDQFLQKAERDELEEPAKEPESHSNSGKFVQAEKEVSDKEDAPPPASKTKHSLEVPKTATAEKERVSTKKAIENGSKEDKGHIEDKEDSLSIELSSDENEYINIKNDDLFLSGDEEMPVARNSGGKPSLSKSNDLKSSDSRSSRRHSGSKDGYSRRDRSAEKSRSASGSRDERKRLLSSRERERSKRDIEREKSGSEIGSSKKVMDAREVLNWKRRLIKNPAPGSEKPLEKSRNKSIFDRLSGKTERSIDETRQRSGERTRERSRDGSQRALSKDQSRSKDDSRSSAKSVINISEDRDRERRRTETRSTGAPLKRQVISISQIAESEREMLRGAQKVAAVKPHVASQVSSKSLAQASRSQGSDSSRRQLQSRRREKGAENRLASRVIAKEPEPESDGEEMAPDVPSVVKVTPRPVIPTAKAAPRNLILKAVAEAEKSIQSSPGRSEKDEWGEDDGGHEAVEHGATVRDPDAVTALGTSLMYLQQHGADLKDIAVIKYWLLYATHEASTELPSNNFS